jgi:MoaA/NifB/PqqE/SkfB family radical SAM enzyme
MPVEVFERVAADLFPGAWQVALACAAEPLVHPRFRDIVTIAGRYRVPQLWFPTNLLTLTEADAEAIVDADVAVVGVSIDGVERETYERIRTGASWERLMNRLELLREVKRRRRRRRPRLRLIFTWMRSNFDQLGRLPEFAIEQGFEQLDVRFVAPTSGVDLAPELLQGEDPTRLRSALRAAAEEAVTRGLWLASYPEFETGADRPRSLLGRLARRLWRWRAGVERMEYWRHLWRERRNGCAFPGQTWVVRPNGAVHPCVFWQSKPFGLYPDTDLEALSSGEPLRRTMHGLVTGEPVGTCATCSQLRDAMYRPLRGQNG